MKEQDFIKVMGNLPKRKKPDSQPVKKSVKSEVKYYIDSKGIIISERV